MSITRLGKVVGSLLTLAATIAWSPFLPRDWPALKASIRASFPSVRHITIAELEAQIATGRVLLIDTRAEPEFRMSRIEGAHHAPNEAAALALLASEPRDRPIVLYCSVGYRSADLAARLSAQGFTRIANLEGSIFEWANSGRPLVAADGAARVVHPYSRSWGKFLDRRFWPERW